MSIAASTAEAQQVTVCVPMSPASEMFPNRRYRRGGFRPGIAASSTCREVAGYAAMEVARTLDGTITGPVHLTIHAAYGYKRTVPDLDATISATKPMVDSLVDAGIIRDDRQIVQIIASHEKLRSTRKQRPSGYTILTITEVTT